MAQTEQVVIPVQKQKFIPVQTQKTRTDAIESSLRKIALAALTMMGIGYMFANAPIALLIGNSIKTIPIDSQASINAITGRLLFSMASIISAVLGGVLIYGGVQFYEGERTKEMVSLGVMLGSFYLLCLGIGSTLLLTQTNLPALMLTTAPLLIGAGTATYMAPNTRVKLVAPILGFAGAAALAYAIFNLRIYDLAFGWNIPFTGPFMSLTVVESVVVILGSAAACVNSFFGQRPREKPFAHLFIALVALAYGLGTFIGSLILSMNLWNLIWKSPWAGPLQAAANWVMSIVVFWSASLVLLDVGGILLIVAACVGFVHVSREFSKL